MATNSPQPLFTYSVAGRMIKWAIAALFVTPFYVWVIFLVSPNPFQSRSDFLLLLIGLLPEVIIIRDWQKRVRRAEFFEEYARITGRNLSKEIRYGEIERVSLIKGTLGSIAVSLFLKDKSKPLDLFWNPTNKPLKTDLYTWLV